MPFRPWTQEQMDYLALLWKSGRSLSEIALEMNTEFDVAYFTRSAMGGKVGRMKLNSTPRIKLKPKARAARKPVALSAAVAKPAPPPPREPVVPPTIWLELIDLGPDTCRYPHGDRPPFAFCGCPVAPESPYCPVHTDLCLNSPPIERNQRNVYDF